MGVVSPRQERIWEMVGKAQHLGAQSYLQYCSTQSRMWVSKMGTDERGN